MRFIIAKTAGFCYGVKRAVNIAEETSAKIGKCYTYGPIIHNEQVVESLKKEGVEKIDDLKLLERGDTIIIRSHGAGRGDYEEMQKDGLNVVDATCPNVSRIHEIVRKASEDGRQCIIVGTKSHPEVRAISQWCTAPIIVKDSEELQKLFLIGDVDAARPITVVYQTTETQENKEKCDKIIKKECTNYKIFDTICGATSMRQKETELLSAECEAMVVIGGKSSANSRRLADISAKNCAKTIFIETAEELDIETLRGADTIGITAGASTPAWIIKEVYKKMSDELKTMGIDATEEVEKKDEIAVGESLEDTESFDELLEKNFKTLSTGEKVTGIVTSITPTEVSVDLGTKQSGYIPLSELTDDASVKAEDIVHVGDEIETYVMRVNDVEGTVMLSKKRLDTVKSWEDIEQARVDKTPVEGIVIEENKGGIIVSVKGVRVFVPASQTGLPKGAPMSSLLKTKVKMRITEVNARRRVVGSIRAIQNEERKAAAEKIWNEIEVGKVYTGVVKSLTSYGAFVDIGGIDGMVHVSEMSWNRIKNPAEVLSVGDKIEVHVLSFDKDARKISLGYRKESDNPWTKFTNEFQPGSVAKVKIVKLMPFGAFAEVIPGVDGLIHISQIADRRIGKPDEVLSEGQEVDAKITNIDMENKKVSLSIRALIEPEAASQADNSSNVEVDDESPKVVYDTEVNSGEDYEGDE